MLGFLKNLVSWLLRLVPTTDIVVFNSYPDYTDNAYAMFRYLSKNGYWVKYSFAWLVNEKSKVAFVQKEIDQEGFRCESVYKMSLKGLWLLMRCRYCFYTHGILESIHIKQHDDKMINMWHGMPIKAIGMEDKHNGTVMVNQQYMLASGLIYQDIIARCFNIDKSKILPIGQPRCDLLFEKTDFFEKACIEAERYDKVGIWLPTYRFSIVKTEQRVDGTYKPGTISFMDEEMLTQLDCELARLNQLLLIKLHPMDKSNLYDFRKFRNILIIKQKDFDSQLYPLLGNCDYLLTDFSSVCIDYDLCKKPMGFVVDDLDAYKESRGFLFDDILSVLPGPILTSYDDLLQFVKNPIYKPSPIEFNAFHDNQAAKRLIECLGI